MNDDNSQNCNGGCNGDSSGSNKNNNDYNDEDTAGTKKTFSAEKVWNDSIRMSYQSKSQRLLDSQSNNNNNNNNHGQSKINDNDQSPTRTSTRSLLFSSRAKSKSNNNDNNDNASSNNSNDVGNKNNTIQRRGVKRSRSLLSKFESAASSTLDSVTSKLLLSTQQSKTVAGSNIPRSSAATLQRQRSSSLFGANFKRRISTTSSTLFGTAFSRRSLLSSSLSSSQNNNNVVTSSVQESISFAKTSAMELGNADNDRSNKSNYDTIMESLSPARKKQKKSNNNDETLFGAVMKKFRSPERDPLASNKSSFLLFSSPNQKKSRRRLSFENETSQASLQAYTYTPIKHNKTTINSNDDDKVNDRNCLSPTGKQMIDMVQNVINSPFKFHSPNAAKIVINDTSPKQPTENTNNNNAQDDHAWHEVDLVSPEKLMTIVDWSPKEKLSFEFHPAHCLPTKSTTAGYEQWQSALRYWQYPSNAIPFLPTMQQTKQQQKQPKLSASSTIITSSEEELVRKLIQSVKGKNASFGHDYKSFDCNDNNISISSFWNNRRRDWQQALRELYLKWLRQITKVKSTFDAVDYYFYTHDSNHVVLFRIGQDENYKFIPQVILSSSSEQFRKQLKELGIKLEFIGNHSDVKNNIQQELKLSSSLNNNNDDNNSINTSLPPKSVKESAAPPMSPSIKADLEAIRRAQAFGATAGADISVKYHKSTASSRSVTTTNNNNILYGTNLPPLLISGNDDVAAFFEVYMNTLGRVTAPNKVQIVLNNNDDTMDVPFISCRKLGPFLHATHKSLFCFRGKQQYENNNNDNNTATEYSSLLIQGGFIMPCAIRELVGAATKTLSIDKAKAELTTTPQSPCSDINEKEEENVNDDDNNNNVDDDDDAIGSHHLIVQLSQYKQQSETPKCQTSPNLWWCHCLDRFNNAHQYQIKESLMGKNGTTATEHYECHFGQSIDSLVWDVTRQDVIAYQTTTTHRRRR